MAEPAQNLSTSSAARKLRGASPVRVLGNLPNSQVANDNARAVALVQDRRGRVLPTLSQQPANDNAQDGETRDVYGAGQRESQARMREINRGIQTSDDETELQDTGLEEVPDMSEYAQDEQESEEAADMRRAMEFQRYRSLSAQAPDEESEEEEIEANKVQEAAKVMAKKQLKKSLQMRIGATGAGLIVLIVWWNYEVFIEGNQPTWKILLVILIDIIGVASAILTPLLPVLFPLMMLAAAGAALPAPVRDALGSFFTSMN